jgi:hypothetical protein
LSSAMIGTTVGIRRREVPDAMKILDRSSS